MKIEEKIKLLHEKDISIAYKNLLELESLSNEENTLYDYFNFFLEMLESEKYVIRVRGYRLICKQAKWDRENKINESIDKLLTKIEDVKPTATRQNIKALHDVIIVKKELNNKIKERLLNIDISKYKDTMSPLIKKDLEEAIKLIDNNSLN